ncbi:MAG TPA: L-threonine 3-dehydrogenase [Candidatus Acidoferrum sp.]|nr:L-threonine 3-dehydrogenase [Candidatus Acidoferrum sp.]
MTTQTMQALRKPRPEPGAAFEKVPVPMIGPTDVLVRVLAASICGTDLHIYGWDRWSASRIKPPMTFGHEFCGLVEHVGDEVTSVKPGEFVSAEMHVSCGHCRQCMMGQPHVCQNLKIIGIDADGCFAEFVRIPAANIWKIDPAIPEHYAAILDPLGNAVHTVLSGPIEAHTVAVTGCGPIGLMAIAVARACGASTIFATEVNAHRRMMALRMGADEALDPASCDAVAHVRAATGGAGADVLLEMSGNPAGIRQGFQMMRPGGRASLLGIPSEPVTLDLVNDVIFKGATVYGIYGRKIFETWIQMTELLKSRKLNLDPLFGEKFPLDQFEEGFRLLREGLPGKVLLYPNGVRP